MNRETLTTGEVAEVLGCRRHQLLYALRSGSLAEPARVDGARRWTLTDLMAARRAMATRRRRNRDGEGRT